VITQSIERDFKTRVCEQIELRQEGEGRFLVFTPFRFDDGDHFGIVLKEENSGWVLSDEANTLMHLSYQLNDADIDSDSSRGQLIETSLAGFSVQNREGELVLPVVENRFGDALFDFIRALTKVTDVSFLSRERVRSTFLEDFRVFLRSKIPENRLQFDWFDEKNDPHRRYRVDAHINGMRQPLYVYALQSDDKVKDATISLLMFEKWGVQFRSMAVYEDQESLGPQPVAKFTDVVGKQFSSLEGNENRISEYLKEILKRRK
jgi:hypothetical protein